MPLVPAETYPTRVAIRPSALTSPIFAPPPPFSVAVRPFCPAGSAELLAGAAGRSPAPGWVSTLMIGVPTRTVTPTPTSSACTRPANGDGNSTAAFAVSISAITWFTVSMSPTVTRHSSTSASVNPSPTSGIEKVCSRCDVVIDRILPRSEPRA